MNARTHRVLVAVTSSLSALAALWAATDSTALGVDPQVTALIAFLLAASSVISTAVRQAWEQ